MTDPYYVDIALPGPFLHAFTYVIPDDVPKDALFVGQRVVVPFRKKELIGFVHRILTEAPASKRAITFKPLLARIDTIPVIPPVVVRLAQWAMAYYLAPPGEVYRALVPAYASKKRLPLDSILKQSSAYEAPPVQAHFLKKLTKAQQQIYADITSNRTAGKCMPALIHGITGSGKTEIYFHLMRDALEEHGQALFLVPEIGLTPQLIDRVRRVFGDNAAVYHSRLTDKQRYVVWGDVRVGTRKIVVGTRSALFLPFQNLQVIIVDEEHEPAYKQEEGFRYHARDLALVRAQIEQALIVMGSATPSLESLWNCERGKFNCYPLKERPLRALLPTLRLVDVKRFRDTKGRIPLITEPLRVAIATHLAKNHQVLLFLNRRGYATLMVCNVCGESLKCGQCAVSMTFHQATQTCICHYCHRQMPLPPLCPTCHAPALVKLGSGTERLETIVSRLFPKVRIMRVDRDALSSKGKMQDFFERMQAREVDIILGTQMLAKGHDYPHITLVGIINADLDLNFPDFRAEERTFQVLAQVSGRAGRAHAEGEVFIQTMNPEHPLFGYLSRGESDAFWQAQLDERKRFAYPPWTSFVQIEVSGRKQAEVRAQCQGIARALAHDVREGQGISLLGPSPAPIQLIRGQYRWQLIVRGTKRKLLKDFLWTHYSLFDRSPASVRVSIDVDPYSLM